MSVLLESAGRHSRRWGDRVKSRLGGAMALAAAATLLAACGPDVSPPADPELAEALGIEEGVPIHQILLSGRGDLTRVLPANLTIDAGDVVQFRVMDGRVHRVGFRVEEMAEEARAFLERTGQASHPPLVEQDGRLVLDFSGAPPANYLFLVEGYGNSVDGRIRVRSP
ncbi:MAG: hypothetical protein WD960_15505 [Gemmatimonadota bacterium]